MVRLRFWRCWQCCEAGRVPFSDGEIQVGCGLLLLFDCSYGGDSFLSD